MTMARPRIFDTNQKRHFRILLLMALLVFVLFAFPNAAASKNLAMVQVFSADESSPLPYVFRMIAPSSSLYDTIRHFIDYGYYPYGFIYFAYSAVLMLPLQWLGLLGNTTLVMLVLRQMVSVLPMLAALLILVYMQDGFGTYRSYLLFIFLAGIAAVVENNLWWHPDGMVTLFAALTLFFLARDRLRFGRNFLLAGVACGLATATKLVGVYFFLAVALVLALGLIQKKISWLRTLGMGAAFLGIMAGTYLLMSPFLFSSGDRLDFIYTMRGQSAAISSGYGIVYAKGLLASWPLVHQYFGELIFLIVAIACAIRGIFRGSKRLLFALILAWLIPLSVYVFSFSHFKFQYWMPAILPVLSCVVVLLPEKLNFNLKSPSIRWIGLAGLLVVVAQFGLFTEANLQNYFSMLHREQGNAAIAFYTQALDATRPLVDQSLSVYYDPNMYMPPTGQWTFTTSFDLLTYDYIQQNSFAVVFIQQSRIRDYLNPNAEGIDAAIFAAAQIFYHAVDAGEMTGYHLVYQNDYGKVFVREDVYRQFLEPAIVK